MSLLIAQMCHFFAQQSVESKFSRQKCRILMQQDVHPKYCFRMFTQNTATGCLPKIMLQGCSLWAMGDRSGIAASRPFSSQPGAKCVTNNLLWLFHICHITVRCQICETKTIIYKRATLYLNLFCSFQLLNLAVGGSVKGPVDQVCIKHKYSMIILHTTSYMMFLLNLTFSKT